MPRLEPVTRATRPVTSKRGWLTVRAFRWWTISSAGDRQGGAEADHHHAAGDPEPVEALRLTGEPVTGRGSLRGPQGVGADRHRTEHQAQHSDLSPPCPASALTNCGRKAAKNTRVLGLVSPTRSPAQRPDRAGAHRPTERRLLHREAGLGAVPDRLHPEVDDVGDADELDRGVDRHARRRDCTEPDADRERLHRHADAVPHDGEQRDRTPDRERATDGEEQARARHLDEEDRGDEEGEPLGRGRHEPSMTLVGAGPRAFREDGAPARSGMKQR